VAQRDSAFLWETEALRAVSGSRVIPHSRHQAPHDDWLTLRQASEVTGVPIPTLRKWALREDVPSYLEKTPVGQLRMVSLQGVYERAAELGRKIETRVVTPAPSAVTRPVVDLTDDAQAAATQPVPDGTMLVPLDAWNKMLNQLGNLHEAGQQLAEARERAAKAETQALFLRERLAELREELARERQGPVIPAAEPTPAEPAPPPASSSRSASLAAYPAAMTRQLWATWKVRLRR
jgi:hypothetical protein